MYDTSSFSGSREGSTHEDAFQVALHPDDPTCVICVVADGQGGHAGAAEAANLACVRTIELALRRNPAELLHPAAWLAVLAETDRDVHATADAGRTTLVAVCINDSRVVGASSGDSAAYVILEDRFVDLTEKQNKNPPVGSRHAEFVPFGAQLAAPWNVVLATDGVWSNCGTDAYHHALNTYRGNDLLQALTNLAKKPGGVDCYHDTTIVLVEPA